MPRTFPSSFFLFLSDSPLFFFFLCLSSLIIHLFFSDAKTTTNRTTAQIMYSVKSSLSGGRRRGDSENVHWSETREHPDRERLNVTPQRGGKEEKQMPEGERKIFKKTEWRMQFVSHKSPISGIKVLKWRITMNNLWLQPFQADCAINVGDKKTVFFGFFLSDGPAQKLSMWGGKKQQSIIQGSMNLLPNPHPSRPLTQPPYFKSPPPHPPSPLHLERLDLECLRGELVPRLSHYARMDPDSSHLSPSRKHNAEQISCHYLVTLVPPIRSYMTISHVCLATSTIYIYL